MIGIRQKEADKTRRTEARESVKAAQEMALVAEEAMVVDGGPSTLDGSTPYADWAVG